MKRFIACVPFFSLPEFPRKCGIVKKHGLPLRDVLLCNRNNKLHFDGGFQYDPHIEGGEYRFCEKNIRNRIMNEANRYCELYLLFRTNYIHPGGNTHYMVGYYKIKNDFSELCGGGPVLRADEIKFVSIDRAIPLADFYNVWKNHYRVALCNTPGNAYQKRVEGWLEVLMDKSRKNKASDMVKETKRLDQIRSKRDAKKEYAECEGCDFWKNSQNECPLVWRRLKWGHPKREISPKCSPRTSRTKLG